ncbi:hypothetical protein GCM10018787_11070 [Streptomyces thermodiastaticus]|nr:hypothetical protein GCM10018787_11070 [Streptomyces thermodiastaticus]
MLQRLPEIPRQFPLARVLLAAFLHFADDIEEVTPCPLGHPPAVRQVASSQISVDAALGFDYNITAVLATPYLVELVVSIERAVERLPDSIRIVLWNDVMFRYGFTKGLRNVPHANM